MAKNSALLFFVLMLLVPRLAAADNVVFSPSGVLANKLFEDDKFISLNKRIIDCESGKFVFNNEILSGIDEPSYHNIIGKVGNSCLYNSNYMCGIKKCFASCELGQETIKLLKERFENLIILSVKRKVDSRDILEGAGLDAEIFESFKRECSIEGN